MNDPSDQRASDEAIKRTTNLTPVGVREALNANVIDFQRRTDAAAAVVAVTSAPKQPAHITTSETHLDGSPVTLPTTQQNNQSPFQGGAGQPGGAIPDVILVLNGTAYYATLVGTITGPV